MSEMIFQYMARFVGPQLGLVILTNPSYIDVARFTQSICHNVVCSRENPDEELEAT